MGAGPEEALWGSAGPLEALWAIPPENDDAFVIPVEGVPGLFPCITSKKERERQREGGKERKKIKQWVVGGKGETSQDIAGGGVGFPTVEKRFVVSNSISKRERKQRGVRKGWNSGVKKWWRGRGESDVPLLAVGTGAAAAGFDGGAGLGAAGSVAAAAFFWV